MSDFSLIPYIGGKYALIDSIVPIIEWCKYEYNLDGYLELCGGGARMLLNIKTNLFDYRLYNDMDIGLSRLFACVTRKDLTSKLKDKLKELGYNEEIFEVAKKERLNEDIDIITSAAYTYICAYQSRAAAMISFNKSSKRKQMYTRKLNNLYDYCNILSGIEVTQGDCKDLLKSFNHYDNHIAYIDPPYVVDKMTEQEVYKYFGQMKIIKSS